MDERVSEFDQALRRDGETDPSRFVAGLSPHVCRFAYREIYLVHEAWARRQATALLTPKYVELSPEDLSSEITITNPLFRRAPGARPSLSHQRGKLLR